MEISREADFVDISLLKEDEKTITGSEIRRRAINSSISFVATNLDCIPLGSERILSDHLILVWDKWESKVTSVCESAEVPVHDMSRKGSVLANSNFKNDLAFDNIFMENESKSNFCIPTLTLNRTTVAPNYMQLKSLSSNNFDDAIRCCAELYRLILMDYLHLAVAYFRGYKELFGNSVKFRIRQMFTELNEVETLREIFIQKELEKLIYGVKTPEKAPHA